MGFFKNIAKNPFKTIAGAGIGSAVLGPAGMAAGALLGSGNGGKIGGSITDMFLGKKAKDIRPDAIANEIRSTQSMGLKELNNALNDSSGENTVRLQNAQQTKGILSSAQDARRNAQKLMAQRGLSGSSLGLSSQRSIDQQAGNDLASVQAQLPGQIRDQKLADAQTRIQAGGINQNGMNFNTIQGQRSGGVLGIAGQLAPMAGSIGQVMSGVGALKRATDPQARSGYGGNTPANSYDNYYMNGMR